MKAFANQNFTVYRLPLRDRLNVTEGDTVEVISKEETRSKVRFLDGEAAGTIQTVENFLLDFEEQSE